jgi:hypothetical protein
MLAGTGTQRRAALGLAMGIVFSVPASAADSMTVDVSWKGVTGCTAVPVSPPITVAGVPPGTKTLFIVLNDLSGHRELGGNAVPYVPGKPVPRGAVYTLAPCVPGIYEWTVTARAEDGKDLATVKVERTFPAP